MTQIPVPVSAWAKTEGRDLNDFLTYEVDQFYCRDSVKLENNTGADARFEPGLLLVAGGAAGEVRPSADNTTATTLTLGFLTTKTPTIPNTQIIRLQDGHFARGPARLDMTQLHNADGSAPSAVQIADLERLLMKHTPAATRTTIAQ